MRSKTASTMQTTLNFPVTKRALRSFTVSRRTCSYSPADSVCGAPASLDKIYAGQRTAVATAAAEAAKRNAQTWFDRLPIEMNQCIAGHIENDDDLDSFCNTCVATSHAVNSDNMSFWRRRFLATFEESSSAQGNGDLKKLYFARKEALKRGPGSAGFQIGCTWPERQCLQVMRDLLIEAFSEKTKKNALVYESKNLDYVLRIAKSHNIADAVFNPAHQRQRSTYPHNQHESRLLQVIQVMLAPLLFGFEMETTIYRFPESQEMAYATAESVPIFDGLKVDMGWLLHNINFWRWHLITPNELSLEPVYSLLSQSDMPQFWSTQLCNGNKQEIGRKWKGAYAYVDHREIQDIRDGQGLDREIQDEFCGAEDGSEFQDLDLKLGLNGKNGWPDLFEESLHSLQPPPEKKTMKTRVQTSTCSSSDPSWQPRSFRFGGEGSDDVEAFLADGWLNPLPSQEGIPGWQRMTMMKYFQDSETGIIEYSTLWAYEGVLLPGGKIMIGRWWSPHVPDGEDMYSGPFLLWCIDGALEE